MKSDTKWAEILASLDNSAAELSAEELARIDGLPHKQSDSNSTGSALGNMDPGQPSGSHPPMTKAQIKQHEAMFAETRKFQDECDDARWANETPEEFERIRSILRQRNNIYPGDDVERASIQWAVPIGTAIPYPDWVLPHEDEEYKKKVAIARMLPTIRPELYVPGRNVYPNFPPLNPRVKAHYFPDAPPDIMAPAPEQPSDLDEESGEQENVAPVILQPRTFAVLRGPDYRYPEELAARIVPATPYGFSSEGRLSPRISPRGQPYGHCDRDGVFHPLPSLPTPERLQELEERKRNEPRELPSPSISRLRKSPSSHGTLYGTSNSMSNSGSPAPQPKSILRNKASRAYLTSESEEDLNAASMDVNTDTRHEVNTSANDENSIAENNISETHLKPAVKSANLTEQSGLFNMENSVQTDNMEDLVKETNITSDKKVAKKKRSFYNLKQSFSFTKLNQSLLHNSARDNTAPINEDSSNTGVEQSSSATKRNKPMVSFDITPEKADTEKKSGFRNFMKSLSPRKRSGMATQIKEAGMSTDTLSPRERSGTVAKTKEANMSTDKNTASVQILGDGLPADADRVKGSTVEPVYITVVKSPKNGGLREQMRKLRNNNADDRFAEDISFDCEPDEEVDDILLDLAKAGMTDTKSSKKQKSPQAQKGGPYPAIYTSTGVRLDGSLAAEYAGMGSLGRSNSTARGLEARKLAEIQAVDGERSEAERYVSSLHCYGC